MHAGDAILGVLLGALDGSQPDLVATREPYETFLHLNDQIDRTVVVDARVDEDGSGSTVVVTVATGAGTEAIELRVEPSRFLYEIDREAYVEALKTAGLSAPEEADEEGDETTAEETAREPARHVEAAEAPVMVTLGSYAGALTAQRKAVSQFLQAEGVDPRSKVGAGRLIDSLLGTVERNMSLDWKQLESAQARLKIACKRVFVAFGVGRAQSDALAERFVSWLWVQVPASDTDRP
jgi:hypothetical protein